jgi:hypothetical protein
MRTHQLMVGEDSWREQQSIAGTGGSHHLPIEPASLLVLRHGTAGPRGASPNICCTDIALRSKLVFASPPGEIAEKP